MAIAKSRRFFYLVLLAVTGSFADEEATHDEFFTAHMQPWFTGPIIAPSGYTVPPGNINIQPYLFITATTGMYDPHWHVEAKTNFYVTDLRLKIKAGVCRWMDVEVMPQAYYKETQGVASFALGDLPVVINFQLIGSQMKDPWPAIKLGLRTNVPCGKYQEMSERKLGTDSGGNGTWEPGPTLSFAKLWNIYDIHYLEARLAIFYRFGTPASVKGFNKYGGASDTRGTIYPGNVFSVDGSIQYSLTREWAFACDLVYNHQDRTTFSGYAGTLSDGTPSTNSVLSNEQFSIAPALEYNLNKNLGFLGGVWFTVGGRNSDRFVSGVISFNAFL